MVREGRRRRYPTEGWNTAPRHRRGPTGTAGTRRMVPGTPSNEAL
jgi:hypothetical protein